MRYRPKRYLTDNILAKQDDVSELENDIGYTDNEKVKETVLNVITADFIQAINAKFSEAQIAQLEAGEIVVNSLSAKTAKIADSILVTDPSTGETLFEADTRKIDDTGRKIVKIAGWRVNNQEIDAPNNAVALYSGTEKVKDSLINSGTSPVRIMAGSNQPQTASFVVLDDGSCYASKFKSTNTKQVVDSSNNCDIDFSDGYIKTKFPVYTIVGSTDNIVYILQNTFWFNNKEWVRFMKINLSPNPISYSGDVLTDSGYVNFSKDYMDRNMVAYGYNHIFIH